ncbi:MAG TPA: type I secretion C-terminal target domain-containing protein [Sphingomonas sp.]|jgi:pectate lyase|uniref:pectate lyase family protein n=1 Tax=Sphingomonas sp. TaxID=28214 RepID=UPI002EDA5B86
MTDTIRAFAGAEGYGAGTVGGRGGAIVHVTSLNDSGEGSLRWALETVKGPRIIVFDVGGTISLKSQILVEHGQVTIAGQSAPGEGIVIEGARIRIKASEVIMRGLHMRPGDAVQGEGPDDRDGLMIGTTDFTVKNVVIDHNSFSWGIDENVSINGRVKDVSFTNNIVAEGLSKSLHSKGEHSKGLLISNWEGAADDAARITVAKNLFSDNMQRNPEVRAGQDIEIVNNFIYNYGLGHIGTSIGGGSLGTLLTSVDVIGNVYTPGLSTGGVKNPVYLAATAAGSTITLVDNVLTSRATDSAGNQAQTTLWRTDLKTPTHSVDYVRTGGSGIAVLDSSLVRATVLASAGAINGSGHDAVDQRIIAEATNGTGKIIDKTSDVASVSVSKAAVSGAADTDRDGMTDWFEDLYGFNKRAADQNGDNDRDGYTNVEEYLNGIISGFDLGATKLAGTRVAGTGVWAIEAAAASAPIAVTGLRSGDSIDLSAVVKAFNPATAKLADFVEIAYAGGDTYVSVDTDGPGGSAVKTLVAVARGAHLTMADLRVDQSRMTGGDGGAGKPDVIVKVAEPVYDPNSYLVGTINADTHTIRNATTRIREAADGGLDLAVAYVDYTLDTNVENLSLKGPTAVAGVGNGLANKMSGNELANRLDGLGGDDRLTGGDGNDRLSGGDGNDWVEGSNGNDVLFGNLGADTLVGGAGRDAFCFGVGDTLASAAGCQDRIVDFGAGDQIFIAGAMVDLSTLATGTIKGAKYADAFAAASKIVAGSADMALVNGTKESWLFWDTDGDQLIDAGVMLSGAALTHAAWSAPSSDTPLI